MVIFKTTLDAGKVSALNKNTFKRLWWVYLIASLIFVGIGVAGIVFAEDSSDFYLGIFLAVFGVLFTPLAFLITLLVQKIFNNSMPVLSDNTVSYFTFDQSKITIVQTKSDDYYAETKMAYQYLHKVIENRDYYFLYISKTQCHVIDKVSLTQGSLSELNTYLFDNLGFKFQQQK